ncbi:hypothetical protein V6M93_01335 [Pectobacterium brasiliense]|uniref:hypothetical protein n=1 Tax=Pectobacterium brasiliense TaxID=180957 RepID=UPI00227A0741|nr:hypothetical protein [Pectobacterium brasiliense]WGL29770.1 hypothetical protein OWC53_09615 [Pectobacterium brasiliense]WJM80403.1 hypothetical protein QTI90_19330 [Pectobacterium brasiliense]
MPSDVFFTSYYGRYRKCNKLINFCAKLRSFSALFSIFSIPHMVSGFRFANSPTRLNHGMVVGMPILHSGHREGHYMYALQSLEKIRFVVFGAFYVDAATVLVVTLLP